MVEKKILSFKKKDFLVSSIKKKRKEDRIDTLKWLELNCSSCDNSTHSEHYSNHVTCDSHGLHKNWKVCEKYVPNEETKDSLREEKKKINFILDI